MMSAKSDSSLPKARRSMRPRKSDVTRAAILDAGYDFLREHPFRDMTVGSLMAKTSYSRATFYMHFNDLHTLMEVLLDEVKDGIVDGAAPWFSNEVEALKGLQDSLTAVVEVGFEQGHIFKAVTDAASSDRRLETVWESFVGAFDEIVAERIRLDQSAGITPEFDALPVARALNRMDAAVVVHAFGGPQKQDKTEVFSALLRVWVSTLYPFDAKSMICTGQK